MASKLMGVVVAGLLFASTLAAQQFRGIGASVTSVAPNSVTHFGARSFSTPGIPPSVTSIMPSTRSSTQAQWSMRPDFRRNGKHHGRGKKFVPIYVPFYSYPYYPYGDSFYPDDPAQTDPNYTQEAPEQPALTIFDSGPGYRPPPVERAEVRGYSPAETGRTAENAKRDAEAAPEPVVADQTPTVLVFRDGRKLEVGNYAIQGETLFNLSGVGPRKINLADLDLDKTIKLNDDRGNEFRLPKKRTRA